ncbi:kinase binding protein CGI-121-domain-containing protein [Limtongia smithiae]|uniref:kinase binding protein CGI-121-domain-containing protein n=1 Tax=Limtongia smithiae TaxID=1125753 RepID=UPI0034CEEF67
MPKPTDAVVLTLPQLPAAGRVCLALYRDVHNAAAIRAELLAGNTTYARYAFLDPRTVYSVAHVLAAVYRALTDCTAGSMRTRSVASEIVFAMAPSMNIADGLRRFGIKDDNDSLLVITLVQEDEKDQESVVFERLDKIVTGHRVVLSDASIAELTNIELLRKNYKFPQGVQITDPTEANNAILGAVALRGYS